MALSDFFKGAVDIGKAMGVTLKYLGQKPVTTEYRAMRCPSIRVSGQARVAATKTAWNGASAACSARRPAPPAPSTWTRPENDPENPTSPGERYAKVYEVNLLRCVFCGDCEEACPTEAIVLGHDFAMANYNRRDFILTKHELLNPGMPNVVVRPE
ncbi:MAG: 4Fe-4S binding protein [Caldilineaceae bacterium]